MLTGEIPDPTHIPAGCRFHPRCPALADGPAAAAGVEEACRTVPLQVLPAERGAPRRLPPGRRARRWAGVTRTQPTEGPGGLQAALPREMYVDPDAWRARAGRGCCSASGSASAGWPTSGSTEPGRVAVVDVVGESVLVTSDDDGALHAAYNVCRHRGSQLFPLEPGAGTVCEAAGALRCPYHSWTYGLDGRLLRAPHTELTDDERRRSRCTRSASTPGRGSSSSTWTPPVEPAAAGRRRGRRAAERLANYAMGELVTGLRCSTYEVAANYKVIAENYNECYHCGPVHPELTRLVPAFGGGGQRHRLGRAACRTARARGRSR